MVANCPTERNEVQPPVRAILPRRVCDRETPLSIENIAREVRAEISRLEQVLALLGESPVTRGISAEGRKRIAAATRARWAKIRAEKAAGTGNSGVKPRRKLSAAGRKRIAAAQKARWAKIRAGKK
jgi:hypothetical protein